MAHNEPLAKPPRMVYNMSDNPQAEELKQRWEKEDRLEIERQYLDLLSTSTGRKFLFYQLGLCKINQNPFTPNALSMSFACGEMNIGQRILFDILSVAPDMWAVMQKEANDVYRTREQSLAD